MGANQDSYALPASLKGESFEMKPQGPQDPPTYSTKTGVVRTDGHAPYLGLQARLSQIWLNRWTILLILVLVRVLLMLAGLNDNLGEAKIKALSACTKVEDAENFLAVVNDVLPGSGTLCACVTRKTTPVTAKPARAPRIGTWRAETSSSSKVGSRTTT